MKSLVRPRVTEDLMVHVASRLTQRDRAILRAVRHSRVLTTDQVCDLYFDNVNTAQHRLTILHKLRLLDRFQIHVGLYVTSPYHYVIDNLGAWVLAAEDGKDIDKVRWNKDKALSIGRSQRLAHLVGTNGFFTALARTAQHSKGMVLYNWLSEWNLVERLSNIVLPDGSATWVEAGQEISFFLEYDRSTETTERVRDKLTGYEDLEIARGKTEWVLFWLRSDRRETSLRAALCGATVPVATGVEKPDQTPAEAVWLPLSAKEGPRLRLIELATYPKPHEARVRAEKAYRPDPQPDKIEADL